MTSPMLEAIAVTKEFGTNRALDSVSLSVASGEIYCLLGANGAGKTTLINLFLGFLEPTQGEVRINGRDTTVAVDELELVELVAGPDGENGQRAEDCEMQAHRHGQREW